MTTSNLIISTEYHMNQPSVFLLNEGNYFGCKIYPSIRNYPKDANYWKNTTGSDSDRFFQVIDVEVSDDILALIKKLQTVVEANESMVERISWPTIKRNWSVKRGKNYQQWKIETEAQSQAIKDEQEKNEPFERARSIAYRRLRNILLSLKK